VKGLQAPLAAVTPSKPERFVRRRIDSRAGTVRRQRRLHRDEGAPSSVLRRA
jgi:hypothetical protein